MIQDLGDSPHLTSAEIGRESEMTAQHKPPYLRRLSFAADPLWFRPEPLLDPSLFDSDCGAFNALDVDQKEEASPWAGRVAASSRSFSRFRYRYLLERGAEALSLTQEGVPPLRLMRTRFPRRERNNEREAPGQTAFVVACIAF